MILKSLNLTGIAMVNVNFFRQILYFIDRELFKDLISTEKSDKHRKGINKLDASIKHATFHFLSAHSVRDISNGLCSTTGDLNYLGIIKASSKSTILYINKYLKQALFKDLYFALLDKHLQNDTHFAKNCTRWCAKFT